MCETDSIIKNCGNSDTSLNPTMVSAKKQRHNLNNSTDISSRSSFQIDYTSTRTKNTYTIRSWLPRDRQAVVTLISTVLEEYAIKFDAANADKDVIEVEQCYFETGGEFWVVQRHDNGKVVGSAAFYPVVHRGKDVVEVRKMYLDRHCRGEGLGKFLLNTLEMRICQLGYKFVLLETASVLKEACAFYVRCGYNEGWPKQCGEGDTIRCDRVYSKTLGENNEVDHRCDKFYSKTLSEKNTTDTMGSL